MCEPAPSSHPARDEDHRTSTAERGAFCLARCTCGWFGPARRARGKARTDAEAHTGLQSGGVAAGATTD
ncbi:MAG TPA: hypothetical protein DEQ61_08460 [Streptomyces sp.]|nr:hypothetical protein [Streptomyces sp.]